MLLKKHEAIYQRNTVNADSFDRRRFNELLKMSKGLQEMKNMGDSEFPLFSQLMGDIWSGLYKSKPQLLPSEEISIELQANHSYMEKVMEDESFEVNREITKLDDLSSALSTISFSHKLMDWIKEKKEANEELNSALNEAVKALNQRKDEETQQIANKNQDTKDPQEYEEKMKGLAELLQKELSKAGSQLSDLMNQSVREANDDKTNMKTLMAGIAAGDGDAEMEKVPLREKFTLAEALKNTTKMKEISNWAGRFKQIARSKQKNMHNDSIERSGVTLGNDVERLLPMELANLAIPTAKNDFLRKFAEGQTMIYDKKGKETLGKGPIILCLDESGSMRDLETQSKGFALALMSIAKRQKRDFALISFSRQANVKMFPKGKCHIRDLIILAESFMNGGTNFYDPLQKSLELINESRFKNADIVFVTDGDSHLPEEFIEKFNDCKNQKRFECLSVLIGHEAKERTVKQFSDKVIYAKDFTEAEKAFEL